MKRILVILIAAIATLSLISCEEEANPADFLTDEELVDLFGEEVLIDEEEEFGDLETPVFIAEIGGVDFIATNQKGTLIGDTLIISFTSSIGNTLILNLSNPANQTYTAGRGSINEYIAEYTIGDGDATYSTSIETTLESIGTLELTNFTGSEVSGTFDFVAFNVDGSDDDIEAINGRFNGVQIQ